MNQTDKAAAYFDMTDLGRDIKGRAVRSGGTMLLSRTANMAIQVISTAILARLLTPEDFGLVTMVTAFSLLLFNVGLNGFTETIVQKEDLTRQQVSTIFWIGLGLSTGLAVLFAASAPLLARFYHEPRVIPITIVLSSGFVFSALATEHLALIMRSMQFHKIMINELSGAVLSVALAVWMANKGFGYWAIVARQLSLPVIGACMAWLQCSWRPGRPVRDPAIRPMLKYALHTFGNFTTGYFGQNVDKILLGWRRGSLELGNYDRAYRLAVMPVDQIPVPLGGVALAALSRLRGEPEKYRRYYLKTLSMMSMIGMLVSLILTLSGRDIILLLLGPQWLESGRLFTFFGPSVGLAIIYRTHGWLHLSLGNANRWFRWGLLSFAFTVLAFVVGIQFGALGVVITYGLVQLVLIGPGLCYAGRPIGIRLGAIWRAVWRPTAAALLAGLAVTAVLRYVGPVASLHAHLQLVLRVVFVSAVCTVAYGAAVILFHASFEPLWEMVRMALLFFRGADKEDSPKAVTKGGRTGAVKAPARNSVLRLGGRIQARWQKERSHRFARRTRRWPGLRPFISFTFDDFPRSAYLTGGKILRNHSLRGTYYASFGLMGQDSPCGKIFTAADVESLLADGHELGSHTHDHLDPWLTKPAEFEASLVRNANALRDAFPGRIFRTFAYPLSEPRPKIKLVAERHFAGCRGGGRAINSGAIDLNGLKSFFIDKKNRDDLGYFRALIEKNRRMKGWLIFSTHDVADDPSFFGSRPEVFEAIVRWAVESGAVILPVAEVLDQLKD